MRTRIEYTINNRSKLVEKLILFENKNNSQFDNESYYTWKKLAEECSNSGDISMFANGFHESLKEDFSNFDLINYNDFLADSFDGWSDDIDYLIKDLNKVAKALRTSAQKLVFYIDYNEEFWAVDEIADVTLYLSEDYSIYEVKDLDIKFAAMIPDNVWIFKNEKEANKIISSVKKSASYSEEDELKEELIKHKKLVKNFFDIINESLTHM